MTADIVEKVRCLAQKILDNPYAPISCVEDAREMLAALEKVAEPQGNAVTAKQPTNTFMDQADEAMWLMGDGSEQPTTTDRAEAEKFALMSAGEFMSYIGVDGSRWAEAFCALHGGDEGLMLSWFSNAIEAGRCAALRAPVVVPDGWQLVPKEPTENMLEKINSTAIITWSPHKFILNPEDVYTAVLSAVPTPEEAGE